MGTFALIISPGKVAIRISYNVTTNIDDYETTQVSIQSQAKWWSRRRDECLNTEVCKQFDNKNKSQVIEIRDYSDDGLYITVKYQKTKEHLPGSLRIQANVERI
jgi:hypothetical protein